MLQSQIFSVAVIADQVVIWILVLLSVLSLGIILERFFALRRVSGQSEEVRRRVQQALQSHSVEEVENLSRSLETVEGRALNYAMKHMKESGSKGLEEAFDTFALVERPDLERYLNFLATVGSNAPYIGLLGTVLGIMKAFNDLAMSPDAGQQTVMAGISVALIATAAGLFVAIPAVISYNYYQRKVRGVLQSLESVKELCLTYAKKKGI
jgi:biopolymer transport protein TolQ